MSMTSPVRAPAVASSTITPHAAEPEGAPNVRRRRALVVLSSVGVAQLVGCGSSVDDSNNGLSSPADPDQSGSSTPNDSGSAPPNDAGTTPPNDAGTTSPTDAGSTPPTDSGSTPPADSGSTPPTDGGSTSCTPKGTNVGAVSSFPENSWKGLSGPNLIVGHDSGGLFAYTAKCTHAGCSLASSVDGSTGDVTCPCHSWQFDGTGACLTRSSKPLQHYAVESCGGDVYVDTSTPVAATTRTAP